MALPHDDDAERAVLGALMLDNGKMAAIGSVLTGADFYFPANGKLFDAIRALVADGKPADEVTVAEHAGDDAATEYLMNLASACPTAENIGSYARIVRDKALARRLIAFGHDVQVMAREDAPKAVIEAASRKLFELSRGQNERRIVHSNVAAREALKRIEHAYRHPDEVTGVRTGLTELDELLGGFQPADLIVLAARPSMGKAQPLDAKVLTPAGFVTMGEIKRGDLVIGADGHAARVVGVYPQGRKQVYRVTMTDGSSTECCAEHLWVTQTRNERRTGVAGSVKDTTTIRETLKIERGTRINHHLPTVAPVSLGARGRTLLHPWLVGILLSDGDLSGATVSLCNPEPHIRERFAALLPAGDEFGCDDGVSVNVRKRHRGRDRSETSLALAHYGLGGSDSFTKFIPDAYLYATVDERIALLRGILDADGFVTTSGHSVEYSTVSERLKEGVTFLARSLGGIVSCANRTTTYSYNGEKRTGASHWRLVLRFPGGLVPVSSSKHLRSWRGESQALGRGIESIELSREVECQCIMLDSADHLYVTDDFIVTHNTALIMNVLEGAATRYEKLGLLFELEMSEAQLSMRAIASAGRVNLQRLKRGALGEADFARLARGAHEYGQSRLVIDETAETTLADIRSVARQVAVDGGLDLIAIDYLQLLSAERDRDNREREVAEFSRGLKKIAKELNVPIIALSQLNRQLEARKDKRPMPSDLRESGAIEQDADVILFLYRDEVYDEDTEAKGIAEVICAKQRNGPTGTVKLRFDRDTQRFDNLDRRTA